MKLKTPITANSILTATPLITDHIGPLETPLSHFSSLNPTEGGGVGFISKAQQVEKADNSSLSCIMAPIQMKEAIQALNSTKLWLFSPNVALAARDVKKNFFFPTPYKAPFSGLSEQATIDPSATIADDVTIGPRVLIGPNVTIGSGSFIGANCVVEANTQIGQNVTIHPLVYIGHSVEIGDHCEIMPQSTVGSEGFGYAHDHLGNHYRVPHTGTVILENDVHIGAGVAIDRGTLEDTRVGEGTKIDNQVHLAHNTIIGKNCLITAQMVVAGSTTIGNNFICGGKTAIAGHINITDNVNVAALSGITNDVKEPGQYGGFPLIPLKQHLKIKASMNHLPEFRKQLHRLLKKVFPEDYNS